MRVLDAGGGAIDAPAEWTPALVEVLVDPAAWEGVRLTVQGAAIPVSLRRVDGVVRVVADWPRSGPGRYRLHVHGAGFDGESVVSIAPGKLSRDAFAQMLEDLEARLPVIVALGLQRAGGLIGVALPPPGQTTVAQEVVRLRRAVLGVPGRPGLAQVLDELARDPHRMLRPTEFWVREDQARRPHPARLAQALARSANLTDQGRLARVLDSRVDPSPNVYENRLVLLFHQQVALRLRRLGRVLAVRQDGDSAEIEHLRQRLLTARRHAAFLDDIGIPSHFPMQTTMVLLKRPPYRAALEGFLELHRTVAVRLDDPALEVPLENLPRLYQLWGTLQVIAALLDTAASVGFVVTTHQFLRRDGEGFFAQVLPGGCPALILAHPGDGRIVRLVPERTFGIGGQIRSVSYPQRPDVTIEVESPNGRRRLYLFDPKYKLDGEPLEGESWDARPKKVDIDKMHAYRDAIRDASLNHVVDYAAILYPGPEVRYPTGIEALSAYPGAEAPLLSRLRDVLAAALAR